MDVAVCIWIVPSETQIKCSLVTALLRGMVDQGTEHLGMEQNQPTIKRTSSLPQDCCDVEIAFLWRTMALCFASFEHAHLPCCFRPFQLGLSSLQTVSKDKLSFVNYSVSAIQNRDNGTWLAPFPQSLAFCIPYLAKVARTNHTPDYSLVS